MKLHGSLSPRLPRRPGIGRVGAAFLLLVVIAASVHSDVGPGDARAPRWLGLAVVLVASAAAFGGLLGVVSAGGYAAFAGTGLRRRASVAAIGAVLLAGIFLVFLMPRWEPDRPWSFERPRSVCVDPGFWWLHYPNRREELSRHAERFCTSSGGAERVSGRDGTPGEAPRTLVVAVAGGAVVALIVAAVAMAIAVRRSRHGVRAPIEKEDAVVLALDESLEDLRRERDVRRAVIACYARMERALAAAGIMRQPHEAPLEYLTRVLERIAAVGASQLTALFERAEFSVEPMGSREKEQAIAALQALRREIARAAPHADRQT